MDNLKIIKFFTERLLTKRQPFQKLQTFKNYDYVFKQNLKKGRLVGGMNINKMSKMVLNITRLYGSIMVTLSKKSRD